jgi:hypothetical protein
MSFILPGEPIKATYSRDIETPAGEPSDPITSDGVTHDERGFSLVEPLHAVENT